MAIGGYIDAGQQGLDALRRALVMAQGNREPIALGGGNELTPGFGIPRLQSPDPGLQYASDVLAGPGAVDTQFGTFEPTWAGPARTGGSGRVDQLMQALLSGGGPKMSLPAAMMGRPRQQRGRAFG